MISIIICSRDKEALRKVSHNVEQTIGVAYEIIAIDNSKGEYGICQAYNTGAQQSKFDIFCFLHEDIKFISKDWGILLINHMEALPKAGVIGLAGSTFKTTMLSSWWQPNVNGVEPKRVNLIQNFKFTSNESERLWINPLNEKASNVACLDGVLLFTNKKIWLTNKFDQNLLKGFHGYDLDFTLRVGRTLRNYVVFDVVLEHFSEGVNNVDWVLQNYLVHEKHINYLPVIKDDSIINVSLRWVDRSHLEQAIKVLSNFYNRKKKIFILLKLVYYSRLFKPNIKFIKTIFKTVLFRNSN